MLTLEQSPADEERKAILEALLKKSKLQKDISLDELATETAAFLAGDLFDLVLSAKNASARRTLSQRYVICDSSIRLSLTFESILECCRRRRTIWYWHLKISHKLSSLLGLLSQKVSALLKFLLSLGTMSEVLLA